MGCFLVSPFSSVNCEGLHVKRFACYHDILNQKMNEGLLIRSLTPKRLKSINKIYEKNCFNHINPSTGQVQTIPTSTYTFSNHPWFHRAVLSGVDLLSPSLSLTSWSSSGKACTIHLSGFCILCPLLEYNTSAEQLRKSIVRPGCVWAYSWAALLL